jgi:cytidylate kinase
MLLAQQRDVLHVRVVAAFENRVAYVMQREGLDQGAAQSRIQVKEYDRTRYFETEYRRKPEDAHLYDIVLNTSTLDLESSVEIICFTLQQKAKRLSAQQDELGPAAGLSPYPGQPEDFRPAER